MEGAVEDGGRGGGKGMNLERPKSVNFMNGVGSIERIEVVGGRLLGNGLEVSRISIESADWNEEKKMLATISR